MTALQNGTQLEEAKEKITQGLVGLTLRLPFMASAVMRFRTIAANPSVCPTAMTDGTVIWYSPEFVTKLSGPEVRGLLCHEVLHILFEHPDREKGRDHRFWNLACDYAVNDILKSFGIALPAGALWSREFSGMSAEKIYDLLRRHSWQQPVCSQSGDAFAGQMPANLPPEDLVGYEEAASRGLSREEPKQGASENGAEGTGSSQASQSQADPESDACASGERGSEGSQDPSGSKASQTPQATDAGGYETDRDAIRELVSVLRREITASVQEAGRGSSSLQEEMSASQKLGLAWKEILQNWMIDRVKTDWSTWPPSKKHICQGLYLPSVGVPAPGKIIFAIDTSGSMTHPWLSKIWAEIVSFRDTFPTAMTVIEADDRIQRVRTFEEFEPLPDSKTCSLQGRGGTDFRPVFKWIEEQGFSEPIMLVLATDGWGPFPEETPEVPTIVIKTPGAADFPKWATVLDFPDDLWNRR